MLGGKSERGICDDPSQHLRSNVSRAAKSRRASQTQGMRAQRHAAGKPLREAQADTEQDGNWAGK